MIVIDNQTFTNSTCYNYNDGMINITSSGGIGTLEYNYGSFPSTTGVFVNLSHGNYNVTVTDDNGCSIVVPFTITEPDEIIVSITPIQTICNGANVSITTSVFGGTGPYNYIWSHTLDNIPTITVSPTSDTTYTCQVFDVNGCLGNIVSTNVNVQPGVELLSLPTTKELCLGDNVDITLVASSGTPPYILSYNGDIINSPYTYYPNQSETITFSVTDICGSISNATVDIIVNQLPIVSFSTDILRGCQPLSVSFNSVNTGNLFWNFGDNVSYSNSPVYEYDEPGVYDVTLEVTDSNNCVNSLTISDLIHVYQLPTAKFVANPSYVSIINPVIFFENYSESATYYYWNFGDNDSSTMVNPHHTYPIYPTGTYIVQLVAESNHNCKDTVFTEIIVTDEYTFFAPEAFSPDNDRINDYFRVYGNGISKSNFLLEIYDRWGEIIFQSTDIEVGWDGNINNKMAQTGVYTWLCKFKHNNNVHKEVAGIVTLIK